MTVTSEPSSPITTRSPESTHALPTIVRLVAAAAVLVGGLVHLQLYFSGYRDIPDVGRSFVLKGVVSVVIAGALVVRRDVVVRLAAAALAASTLIALAVSRTELGVFGFQERGLEPSPQTIITIIAEVIVLLAIAITFVPAIGGGDPLRHRIATPIVIAMAVVSIGAAAAWAGSGESNTLDDEVTGAEVVVVSIVDFRFDQDDLEVPVGTTVRWVNDDSFAHSVVAGDNSFLSDTLEAGDVFDVVFESAGQFDYICGLHPSMTATISVVE